MQQVGHYNDDEDDDDNEKLSNSQQNYLHNSNKSHSLKSSNDMQKMNIVSTPNDDNNIMFYDMKRKIEMENMKPKNTFIYSKYPVGLEAIKEITKNKVASKSSDMM